MPAATAPASGLATTSGFSGATTTWTWSATRLLKSSPPFASRSSRCGSTGTAAKRFTRKRSRNSRAAARTGSSVKASASAATSPAPARAGTKRRPGARRRPALARLRASISCRRSPSRSRELGAGLLAEAGKEIVAHCASSFVPPGPERADRAVQDRPHVRLAEPGERRDGTVGGVRPVLEGQQLPLALGQRRAAAPGGAGTAPARSAAVSGRLARRASAPRRAAPRGASAGSGRSRRCGRSRGARSRRRPGPGGTGPAPARPSRRWPRSGPRPWPARSRGSGSS